MPPSKPKRKHRLARAYYKYVRRKNPEKVDRAYDYLDPQSREAKNNRNTLAVGLLQLRKDPIFVAMRRYVKEISESKRAFEHQIPRLRSGTPTYIAREKYIRELSVALGAARIELQKFRLEKRERMAVSVATDAAFNLLFLKSGSDKTRRAWKYVNEVFRRDNVPSAVYSGALTKEERKNIAYYESNVLERLGPDLGILGARRFLTMFLIVYSNLMRTPARSVPTPSRRTK